MDILIPILALGFLGLLFGLGLAVASKRFAIKTDPRLEKIYGLLPGANCGICGGAGCFGFAESLLSGKASIEACRVAEEKTKERIARLLGKELEKKVKTIAILHCNGGKIVKDRFFYQEIEDCIAANLVLGGQKECLFGCLGLGDCEKICPFKAIKMGSKRLPLIDKDKCTGCGKCIVVCPKKLFSLVPEVAHIYVACNSHDLAKDTREACPVGCIACRKCEQVCPVDAIQVIDNLAIIDYSKCTSCGECVKVCPTKTICISSQE